MSYKVDDWVFCEFILQQIKRIEDGRVQEVTDGMFNMSGWDFTDQCMPLTMDMKRTADRFAYVSNKIHREGSSGLNYPDIHRWLVNHWIKMCAHGSDSVAIKADCEALDTFQRTILAKAESDCGYGFPLIRQRVG